MDKNHSCLVIKDDPRDYRLGDGNIVMKANVPDGNWEQYWHFKMLQKIGGFETDLCVIFTACETSVDTYMDFLISTGQLSQKTVDWITSLGFMDSVNSDDGKPHFHSSPLYIGNLTGNGMNGNALQDPWNTMRTYGLVPWSDFPFDMSDDNYAGAFNLAKAQSLIPKGQKFLAGIGGKDAIQFHWIYNNVYGTCPTSSMDTARQTAPLCIGINVGDNWNVVLPPAPPEGSSPGHSVGNLSHPAQGEEAADHYVPFEKFLQSGYPIPQVLQAVITITPPPPAVPSEPINLQNPQSVSLWEKWLSMLSNWLESITPQGTAKLGGASRSPKWGQFKKEYAKKYPPACVVCGSKKTLNLHHLYVFHAFPQYELCEWNVRWLCHEHHLYLAHLGDFSSVDPNGAENIEKEKQAYQTRPMTVEDIKNAMPAIPTQ